MIGRLSAWPIRRKLIAMIMLTSVAVALVTSAGYLIADYYAARQDLRTEIEGQSQLLVENVAPALRFDDPKTADEVVQSLASSRNLRAACVYERTGKLFASYNRKDAQACETTPRPDGLVFDTSRIMLTSAAMVGADRVGTVTIRSDLSSLEHRFQQQAMIGFALLLVTLAVATFMSARLQVLVSDPILRLSRTAADVSQRGDYSLRAAKTSDDELATLVESFNGMLDRIQNREMELSRANEELRHEVTERRRAEQERAAMLVREREANRLKDEFLATLSHELRTPLNAMLGWTRLLRSRAVSTQDQDRALEKVERNAMMQARLVEDLLDVSRITTGKLKLDVRPVDLVAVANTAIDSIRPTAEARGVTIVRRFAEPSLPTGGDPDRLQQVIWNLLSNAVKFTPAGGTVTIGLRRAGDLDHLSVSDTGMGIEPAFLQSVFDTFRQADASATRAHGGLGLGLSIVRHLVELHAGTVIAESAGKSLGATFTVQLPVRTAAADAAIPGGVDLSRARLLAGLTVVVVDDDEDTRELLSSVLGSAGATVDAAANAADALVLCTHLRPDALISDIGMPGRDGYSLIRDVHAALGGSVPRLSVALSAYAAAHDRERAIAAGFDQHIAKPIDPDLLVQELHRLLTGRPAAAS
jgi:signal transduction histidine kinase/ActR/RegA family two-component response regulator